MTFGRVPLFYYLLHFPLIHGAASVLGVPALGSVDWLQAIPGPNTPKPPDGASLELWQVYVVWILIVLASTGLASGGAGKAPSSGRGVELFVIGVARDY